MYWKCSRSWNQKGGGVLLRRRLPFLVFRMGRPPKRRRFAIRKMTTRVLHHFPKIERFHPNNSCTRKNPAQTSKELHALPSTLHIIEESSISKLSTLASSTQKQHKSSSPTLRLRST